MCFSAASASRATINSAPHFGQRIVVPSRIRSGSLRQASIDPSYTNVFMGFISKAWIAVGRRSKRCQEPFPSQQVEGREAQAAEARHAQATETVQVNATGDVQGGRLWHLIHIVYIRIDINNPVFVERVQREFGCGTPLNVIAERLQKTGLYFF